jgi:hypothetical protein
MPDWDLLFIPGAGWDGRIDDNLRHRLLRALLVEGYETPEDEPWVVDALRQYKSS